MCFLTKTLFMPTNCTCSGLTGHFHNFLTKFISFIKGHILPHKNLIACKTIMTLPKKKLDETFFKLILNGSCPGVGLEKSLREMQRGAELQFQSWKTLP